MCSQFISAGGCYTGPVQLRAASTPAIFSAPLLAVCLALCPTAIAQKNAAGPAPTSASPFVLTGYVFPNHTLLDPAKIPARKLTRINYAFADIENGRIAAASSIDAENLAALVAFKRKNPSLQVLISVGGWFGSGGFSDLALTPANRAAFIASAADYIEQNHLDGLDIDWEYPGLPGAQKHFRADDGQNFTLLLAETRAEFSRLEKKLHRRIYLTIAAGATAPYLAHTEMGAAQKSVDAVDLMAYDDYEPSVDRTTGNAAPLYTDPADPKQLSADRAVRAFEQAGVPAAKIILGVPFYGHAWRGVPAVNHGLFQPGKPAPQADVPYGDGPKQMLANGFVRTWDSAAGAASLYDSAEKIFVSYEDPQSLTAKSKYVRAHQLAGMMFWDLEDDPTGALLDTIDAGLRETRPD